MKNFLFIMTHIGSGWEKLVEALYRSPRFDFFNVQFSYRHPDDLRPLANNKHRKDDASAIYADVVLHNKDFNCKLLCNHCQFIFWHSDFESAIPVLLQRYEPLQARRYYDFRLEGMRQYYRRSLKALWNPSLDGDVFFGSDSGREQHG